MRIAVISDTHDRLPDVLLSRLASAEEIWHLGDVTRADILLPLENLAVALLCVRGNCDRHSHAPLARELKRHDSTFHLQHLPLSGASPLVDAALFGHLHQPIDETENGTRLLNPGAITGPRNGSSASFAWLDISPGNKWSWQIETL